MRSLAVYLAFMMIGFAAEKKVVNPPGAKPVGPYSPGLAVGDFIYISGQGARGPDGNLPSAIEGQVGQALNNVKAVVEAAGLTMEHVVYTHLYLADMGKFEQADRVWAEFFPKSPPARAVVGVYRMPGETPVEVNAVAYRDLSRKKVIAPPGFAPHAGVSPGVMAGPRLYLSSALGMDMASGSVPLNPDDQVELAFNNMKRVLEGAGLDFRHVVFVNPYLTDRASRAMNTIYAKYFEFGNTPGRATIRVTSLPHGATIAFTGVAIADLSKRQAVRPKNMRPSPTASPCVLADDTLYCSAKSGFIPGPNEGVYNPTVEGQLRQTMRNLLDGLEEAGMDFSNVVATNVYLDNMDDFAGMNRVYGQYFTGALPTRTTVSQTAPRGPAPVEGIRPRNSDAFPAKEQISLIAVR
jgi:reactive intermediate/imine deaminase